MDKLEHAHVGHDWTSFLQFRSRKMRGLRTGIARLDNALRGLTGLIVIQGAPKCNKSTLALQIAEYNARQGTPVLILDRENGFDRLRERLICCHNNVATADIEQADITKLRPWAESAGALPIYALTAPTYPEELRELLGQMHAHFNRPMMLVVDSIQKMPPLADNERMSIQMWLAELDQLKLDWAGQLVMVATSEKSRGFDNYHRAALGSAKGAGGLEYTAEIVLDMRRTEEGQLVLEIVASRDSLSNVAVDLNPVLVQKDLPQSFTFRLEAA